MAERKILQIARLTCKNFRCFRDITLDLNAPLVLIEGLNGSGKTSLLEALHYACYLRSFRTHSPRDLILRGQQGFCIKMQLDALFHDQRMSHDIQAGFAQGKRLVKVNNSQVSSYRQLLDHYRSISLTEDDLGIVQGGPDERRTFIDHALLLIHPEYIASLRQLKQMADNRNAALERGNSLSATLDVFTQQLWQQSRLIQQERCNLLTRFNTIITSLVADFLGDDIDIQLSYVPKNMPLAESFEDFIVRAQSLFADELRMRRSLFGAHLDDFQIIFCKEGSRRFASRGQQKMIVFLVKIAQAMELSQADLPVVFLIDDYMTDFDERRSAQLLELLRGLSSQLIFTSPILGGGITRHTGPGGGLLTIKLTD